MSEPPSPTNEVSSRAEVFATYLDYFRGELIACIEGMPPHEQTTSRLPSGWTPLELAHHLRWVEFRWIEWGFLGRAVADPWGDRQAGRWRVPAGRSGDDVIAELRDQGDHTRSVIRGLSLEEVGQPSDRWDGNDPPTLERILFHLIQEYARHCGHLDIVADLA